MKKLLTLLLSLSLLVTTISTNSINIYASGNSFAEATGIALGELVERSVSSDAQNQYYVFETSDKTNYSINFATGLWTGVTYVKIYDDEYNRVYKWSVTTGIRLDIKLNKNATYYIEIDTYYYANKYAFRIQEGSRLWNNISTGNDGTHITDSIIIKPDENVTKTVSLNSWEDLELWYRLDTSSNPGSIYDFSFDFDHTLTDHIGYLAIYDGDYNPVYKNNLFHVSIQESYKLKENSIYYIYIRAMGSTSIEFSFAENVNTKKAGKPPITSLKAGKGSFTITWGEAANGASKYQVAYKKNGEKKWTVITVTGFSLTKTITGLKRNTNYSVMVRALKTVNGTSYNGDWCKSRTIKTK